MSARRAAAPAAGALALLAAACGGDQSAVDPAGPRAAMVAQLWWVTFVLGTAVWLLVLGLLGWGITRRGEGPPGPRRGAVFVLAGGAALPVVVTGGLWLYSGLLLNALSTPEDEAGVVIEVTGNQWWWEAEYPELGFVTANEIHVPVDVPVLIRMRSNDVVHSFWVPNLAGKTDLFPGRETTLWIEADEPGVYRGQCAEFCGLQHAKMAFHVVAEPPETFEQWAADQAAEAAAPEGPQGEAGLEVFLSAGCAGCHTIRGTEAAGQVGPDLTHLASRDWIAAGTLPLTRGSLGGWVVDPQRLKRGVLMPPTDLGSNELDALLAYLASLE